MKKEIEVNLGIGMNMFFPETVIIEIQDSDEPQEESDQGTSL